MKAKQTHHKHYERVLTLWERACLGYKCRCRWRRRHLKRYIHLAQSRYDPIGTSLYNQCEKYYKLLEYLRETPQ